MIRAEDAACRSDSEWSSSRLLPQKWGGWDIELVQCIFLLIGTQRRRYYWSCTSHLSAPSCSPRMKNGITRRKVGHILTYNKVRRGDIDCSRKNRFGPAFYRDSSLTARANSREKVKENEMHQIKYIAVFST